MIKIKSSSVFDRFLFTLIFNGHQYIVIGIHVTIFPSPIFENVHYSRVVLICRAICCLCSSKGAYPIAKFCIQAKRIKIIIAKFDQFFTVVKGDRELYTNLIKAKIKWSHPRSLVHVWLLRTFYSELHRLALEYLISCAPVGPQT